MVGVWASLFVAAFVVSVSIVTSEDTPVPPGLAGIGALFAQIEQTCFNEAQYTEQEITTIGDLRRQAAEEAGSGPHPRVDFLEYVDSHETNRTIAQGIRSKFPAFTVCMARETAKVMQLGPPSQ
ncbi:uncharacterized protein LOC144124677 [Amblyomma americanum]